MTDKEWFTKVIAEKMLEHNRKVAEAEAFRMDYIKQFNNWDEARMMFDDVLERIEKKYSYKVKLERLDEKTWRYTTDEGITGDEELAKGNMEEYTGLEMYDEVLGVVREVLGC